jgi:hypothetical protein
MYPYVYGYVTRQGLDLKFLFIFHVFVRVYMDTI